MRDSVDDHVAAWSRELPGLDPLKEQVLARMAMIVQHVSSARVEHLAADGLRMWQYKTLLMLRKQGAPYELAPSALADVLGVTRGALSARLQALEDRGLVRRTHSTTDRRRVTVTLTDAGHHAVETHLAEEERRERAVLAGLSARQQEQLAALLRRVVADLERGDAADGGPGR